MKRVINILIAFLLQDICLKNAFTTRENCIKKQADFFLSFGLKLLHEQTRFSQYRDCTFPKKKITPIIIINLYCATSQWSIGAFQKKKKHFSYNKCMFLKSFFVVEICFIPGVVGVVVGRGVVGGTKRKKINAYMFCIIIATVTNK